MRKFFSLATLGGTPLLLFLCHCQAISSSSNNREGAVYYLPKTEYQVKFAVTRSLQEVAGIPPLKKEDTITIDMNCEPILVVDKSYEYTLHSSANEFFDRNHQLTVVNGLLTSVGIKDNGRLLEITKLVGGAASMVISAGATTAGDAAAATTAASVDAKKATAFVKKINDNQTFKSNFLALDGDIKLKDLPIFALELADVPLVLPPLPDYPTAEFLPNLRKTNGVIVPTPDEVKAMVLQLTPGTHPWQFSQMNEKFTLPGASARIHATFQRGESDSKDVTNPILDLPVATKCGVIRGIVAKNTTKAGVRVSILAEEGMVSELRVIIAKKNQEMFAKYVKELQAQVDFYAKKEMLLQQQEHENPGGLKNTALGKFPVEGKTAERKKYTKGKLHMTELVAKATLQRDFYAELQKTYQDTIPSTAEIPIQENKITVSTTVDDRLVVIPLTRGPIGESTHTLTLSQGTMGAWSFDKKSAVEGLIQIPIELAKSVIGVP
ncbi:MAG: hypothetical protein V4689_12900 [Verrucomicrobiota bacterium]